MTEPTDPDNLPAVPSRRRFLREGGALMGGAVLAGGLAGSDASAGTETDNLPPNVPEWMKTPGDPMGSQLYGTPSPFEKGVIKNTTSDPREEPGALAAHAGNSKESVAISIRVWTDTAAGSRRHHHAERIVL